MKSLCLFYLFLLFATTRASPVASSQDPNVDATAANEDATEHSGSLRQQLVNLHFSEPSFSHNIRSELDRRSSAWSPEVVKFWEELEKDEEFLDGFRYRNKVEEEMKSVVQGLANSLEVEKKYVQKAMEEASDMIRVSATHPNPNYQTEIPKESMFNLAQDIMLQNLRRFAIYNTPLREAAVCLRRYPLPFEADDDWLMDIQLALTLSGSRCSTTTFLDYVRISFVAVYNRSDVFEWAEYESELLMWLHRALSYARGLLFGMPVTLDDYKERMAEVIHPNIREPFTLREEIQRARRTIKREKLNRPNNAGPYDDDKRMTELLSDMLDIELLEVETHMRRARATVRYNIAVENDRKSAICAYTAWLEEDFENAV